MYEFMLDRMKGSIPLEDRSKVERDKILELLQKPKPAEITPASKAVDVNPWEDMHEVVEETSKEGWQLWATGDPGNEGG